MTGAAFPSVTRRISSETELLTRVRDRTDHGAWAEFVDEYGPVLQAFVRSHGVGSADVPDVVQDVYAKLVLAMARFEYNPSRGRFRTWLWRITNSAATNWFRKRQSRARSEEGWRQNQSRDFPVNHDSETTAKHGMTKMLDRALNDVREATSPETWACFEGHVLQNRPANELARELGVTQNSVYVNACRIRARVRVQCLNNPIPIGS